METENSYCDAKMIQIINNLRDTRIRKGMSQLDVAERAELSRTYIYKIEKYKCNITVSVLIKICQALGVKVSQIIPDETPEEISRADVFQYLTKDMNEKEQNTVLEMVRICVGLKNTI